LVKTILQGGPFQRGPISIPNDIAPKDRIKIRDNGIAVGLGGNTLMGRSMTWAWGGQHGKPVFNFISEKRDFSKSDRVIIPATGFYEYTQPEKPKVKLKDRHLFTLKGGEFFWIAGIVKDDCFAMLTTTPGLDIAPYHERQICVIPAAKGADWLTMSRPVKELLAPLRAGSLDVRTLRKKRRGAMSATPFLDSELRVITPASYP
jgi:putative SOS response-associated peptidase YedK